MLYNMPIKKLREIYIYLQDKTDEELILFHEKEVKRLQDDSNSIFDLEKKKLNTDYNGTSVSLTSKDALGLLQVKTAFELGVTKTNFKFQNGTVMEMTHESFGIFAPWFANERNKFFI